LITAIIRKHTLFFILAIILCLAPLYGQEANLAVPKTLTAEELVSKTGAENLHWDPFLQSGMLISGDHQITFRTGNPGEISFALMDGSSLLRLPSPYLENGILYFPEVFAEQITSALENSRIIDLNSLRIAAIIIDPGHGGKDSGAVGTHLINGKSTNVVEKNIVLSVGKDLRDQLLSKYPDKQIIMTRDSDTFPSLEDRVVNAHSVSLKDNEAIVFVSVHANASFNKQARGYEVWYLSPEYRRTVINKDEFDGSSEVLDILNSMMEEEFTTESIMMAQAIMNRFDQNIGAYGPSRGIKAEEWFVVRNARMPSVLAELGFVSNLEDAKLLLDADYLKKLSDALYKGIVDFVSKFEQSGGFTQIQ
jgi:N-acetylmuramoyl-L-alanine amidase